MELMRWVEKGHDKVYKYRVCEGTSFTDSCIVTLKMTRRGAKRACGSLYVDIMDVPWPRMDEALARMEEYKNSPEWIAEAEKAAQYIEMCAGVKVVQTGPASWKISGYEDDRGLA
jgi:hypothetical protein